MIQHSLGVGNTEIIIEFIDNKEVIDIFISRFDIRLFYLTNKEIVGNNVQYQKNHNVSSILKQSYIIQRERKILQ